MPILQLPCYFSGVYSSYSSLNIFVNLAELKSNFSHCKTFRKASEFGIWIWEVVRSYLLGRCNLANDTCVSGIFTWSNSATSAWEQFFCKKWHDQHQTTWKGDSSPTTYCSCFKEVVGLGCHWSRACETGSTEDIMLPDCHSILNKTSPNMSWWHQSTFPFIGPHQVETKMWGVAFLMASWPTRKGCDAGLTGQLTGSQLAPLQDSPTNASRTSYIKHGCRREKTHQFRPKWGNRCPCHAAIHTVLCPTKYLKANF